MHPLTPDQFSLVQPLFTQFDQHLGPQAVINGIIPGVVLVDDATSPRAAFTWLNHRMYLAGDPGEDFIQTVRQTIAETILPAAHALQRERYLLYSTPNSQQQAAALLTGYDAKEEWRLALEMGDLKMDWHQLLPEKLLLQQIDAVFLHTRGIMGRNAIVQGLTADHPTVEDALRHEFGFCLIHRRLIVSRCLSEYAGLGRCEVGIFTHPDFRKQGLASIVACALVERAQFLGFQRIGWHCWEKNRASSTLAHKIGFRLTCRYPVLTGRIQTEESP